MRKKLTMSLLLILLSTPLVGWRWDWSTGSWQDKDEYRSRTHHTRQHWRHQNNPASAVPEPGAALLFGAGMLVLGGALKKRKK